MPYHTPHHPFPCFFPYILIPSWSFPVPLFHPLSLFLIFIVRPTNQLRALPIFLPFTILYIIYYTFPDYILLCMTRLHFIIPYTTPSHTPPYLFHPLPFPLSSTIPSLFPITNTLPPPDQSASCLTYFSAISNTIYTIPYHTVTQLSIPHHTIPYHPILYTTIPYYTPLHPVPYSFLYHLIPYCSFPTLLFHRLFPLLISTILPTNQLRALSIFLLFAILHIYTIPYHTILD